MLCLGGGKRYFKFTRGSQFPPTRLENQAYAALGAAKIVTLDIDNGVRDLERAIKLSPVNAGSAIWKATLSLGQMVLGNQTAAFEMAQQACKDDPKYYPGFIAKALVLAQQNRKAEAQVAIDEATRIFPELDRSKIRNFVGAWAEQMLTEAGIEIPDAERATSGKLE